MQKSYSENPEHYKRLIANINTEADFPSYLHHLGYQLLKKSAGSLEFINDNDRIVLNISRNPVTYFNRNDSTDKGLFFKFLRKSQPNFYETIKAGLEIIDRTYDLDKRAIELLKKNGLPKTLEENYNIAPLQKTDYLTQDRGISENVLQDELFEGRIFNAFHIKDNGGKIGNTAFPKYDLEGNPKNYILYNKPYFDRRENVRKKFRLTLNKKDSFLFYSKPMENPECIVMGESAIDLLSYHELHGTSRNFYISFGGSIYPEKLSFFAQLTEPFFRNEKTKFILAMDNDRAGHEFDIKVFSTLVNQCHPNVYIEPTFRNGIVNLTIHYVKEYTTQVSKDKNTLSGDLKSNFGGDFFLWDTVRTVAFSDKIIIEFPLDTLTNTFNAENKNKNAFKTLFESIGKLYLPFKFGIHKSKGKDWNDDLRDSKKSKYVAMSQVVPKKMAIGDKIELQTETGPEGSKNQGVIVGIKNNGVDCDFGLKYTYIIPFKSIKIHHKKIVNKTISTRNIPKKKSNKNKIVSIS